MKIDNFKAQINEMKVEPQSLEDIGKILDTYFQKNGPAKTEESARILLQEIQNLVGADMVERVAADLKADNNVKPS